MIQFKFRRLYLGFLIWMRVRFARQNKRRLWRELFLLNVLFTKVYNNQSLQDKITSLSKLISLFKGDHGFVPRHFLQILYKMNVNLNSEVIANFEKSYDSNVRTV